MEDALLLEDALFSEEWEERAAEDALALAGRALWLTKVSHLASTHNAPPTLEKHCGWRKATCLLLAGGLVARRSPKKHFSIGKMGGRFPARVMLPSSRLGVTAEPFPGRYGPRSAWRLLQPPTTGSDMPPRPGAQQSHPGGTHPGSGRACGPGRCPLCSAASAGRWRAGPRSRRTWAGWCRGRCPWGERRERLSSGWKSSPLPEEGC